MKRRITAGDILPPEDYAKLRRQNRRQLIELKRHRNVQIGPYAIAHFECYETMWHQVQEMLFIEKGGAEQLVGELEAYNPLIPQGNELVATVMFEIEDETRRGRLLAQLGGVETSMALLVAGESVAGMPEADLERSSPGGKASSVQFIHFPFTAPQISKFKTPGTQVMFAIRHPAYQHLAVLPEPVRAALAEDFD